MTSRVFEGENLLAGKTIFLSASKPTREPDIFPPAAQDEIEEAVRSLARAVFAEGGHLVLGAHPSISPLIVDVATEYFQSRWGDGADGQRPVLMYQSNAFRDVIPAATRDLESMGFASIIQTEVLNGEHYDPTPPPREQCLASLAHMRQRMFAESQPVAMVAVGGMQGVVREARLFLEMFTRGDIYVLTKSGGASSRLNEYLGANVLREPERIGVKGWQARVIPVEERFAVSSWDQFRSERANLPKEPYALLMQKVVRRIAGKSDDAE